MKYLIFLSVCMFCFYGCKTVNKQSSSVKGDTVESNYYPTKKPGLDYIDVQLTDNGFFVGNEKREYSDFIGKIIYYNQAAPNSMMMASWGYGTLIAVETKEELPLLTIIDESRNEVSQIFPNFQHKSFKVNLSQRPVEVEHLLVIAKEKLGTSVSSTDPEDSTILPVNPRIGNYPPADLKASKSDKFTKSVIKLSGVFIEGKKIESIDDLVNKIVWFNAAPQGSMMLPDMKFGTITKAVVSKDDPPVLTIYDEREKQQYERRGTFEMDLDILYIEK